MSQDPYEYFMAALKDALARSPHGTQAAIASSVGKSRVHINDILGGRKSASQSLQVAIADALGLDYIQMLIDGRTIVLGADGDVAVRLDHLATPLYFSAVRNPPKPSMPTSNSQRCSSTPGSNPIGWPAAANTPSVNGRTTN